MSKSLVDARAFFSSLDFYVVLFGLAMCRAWIILCLSRPFAIGESTDWIFLIPGGLAMLAVGLYASRANVQPEPLERFQGIGGLLIALCIAGAPFAIGTHSRAAAITFTVLCGIASSYLQLRWGVEFARRRLAFSLYCYPASAIATALLVAGAFAESGLLAFCVFPLVAFLLLMVSSKTNSENDGSAEMPCANQSKSPQGRRGNDRLCQDTDPLAPAPSSPTIARFLISIGVFSFLCRFYDDFPTGFSHDPLDFLGGSSVFALVVAGIGFLLFIALAGKSFNPLLGYRVSLPLMALGMVIVALFFSDQWYLSVLFIGIGYELFDTLTWMLLVALARGRHDSLSSYAIFGLGTAATLLGMGVGRFAALVALQTCTANNLDASSFGVVGVMSLIITAFLVMPEGTLAQLIGKDATREGQSIVAANNPASASYPESTPMESACDAVANEYRLTPREREVLSLLARGRTLAIVMRDLHIAKGTAQTHMEKVYQKLGVHKQQELIDLVESYLP